MKNVVRIEAGIYRFSNFIIKREEVAEIIIANCHQKLNDLLVCSPSISYKLSQVNLQKIIPD